MMKEPVGGMVATFVVGDVQGCFDTFAHLLEKISFDRKTDRLILLGDVLNRGPNSLKMLRFLMDNHNCAQMILGNHELLAIAIYLNSIGSSQEHTVHDLLLAPDKDDLFSFLMDQPLMRLMGDRLLVHAGILPAISIDEAMTSSHKVTAMLKSSGAKDFLASFFKNTPSKLLSNMSEDRYLQLTLTYCCFIRMCRSDVEMDLGYKGPVDAAPPGLKPWYSLRKEEKTSFYFGHWAALGLYHHGRYHCLDSGCVWGRTLSAIRLDDDQIFQVKSIN